MNKIIKKLAAVVSCFAILLVAGVSLTACGKKEEPTPPPADTTTHVATVEQLTNALKTDGVVITLDANLAVTDTTFTVEKNVTLDLNGHNITSTVTAETTRNLFYVAGGKLTVNATNGGTVEVKGHKDAGYVFFVGSYLSAEGAAKKGELVINAGTFKTSDATVAQATYGSITINGGSFETPAWTQQSDPSYYDLAINRLNNSNVYYTQDSATRFPTTFNYENDVKIVINGGRFKGFNPGDTRASADDYQGATRSDYLASTKQATAGTEADAGWYIVSDKPAQA